jgi:hypothetical protein
VATTIPGKAPKATIETCPYCGQPLLDHDAVRRVEKSERDFERRLDTVAQVKAAELAKGMVEKQRAETEKKIATLSRQLAAGEEQLSTVKREHASELREVRKAVKAELSFEAERKAESKVRTQLLQYDRTMKKLQEQNEEQARRIENLTAEERGEFNEQDLILRLRAEFPDDRIERQKRSHAGADILHEVCSKIGGGYSNAGLIIYECKDTLNWSNSFIDQAKKARITHHTPFVIVISRCFPRSQKTLFVQDDVVVVSPQRVVDIARVVRRMVVEIHRASLTQEDQAVKSEELYDYLASTEFRQAFDAIASCSDQLTELLGSERKWHERTWAKRQSAYDDITRKTSAIDGRVRAIIERDGSSLRRH